MPTYERPNPDVAEVSEEPLHASEQVVVATYHSLSEAELIRGALQGSGVRASLRDQHTVAANVALSPIVGGVKVIVPRSELERADEVIAQRKSNAGRPVFMVVQRAYAGLSFAGLVGGFFVGIVLAMATKSVVALLASTLGGAVLGWWRAGEAKPFCSSPSCGAPLEQGMAVCPKCSGQISGTIAHPDERLEAEERLRSGE